MKTIQYLCPHCKSEQTHEECSLYSTLECSACELLFRLADAIHFYGTFWYAKAWYTRQFGTVGTRGLHTACIFCNEPMPMQICTNGSFAVPDFCPFCTQELPHRVNKDDQDEDEDEEYDEEDDEEYEEYDDDDEDDDEDDDPPMDMNKLSMCAAPVAPAPAPVAPAPAPAPVAPAPAPAPVAPAPVAPAPVAVPPKPARLTGHYKDIYQQAVMSNGGKDLSEKQFKELLDKLK